MRATLHALITHVVDYAGLYPPANLTLDAAFANYLRYRQGPESLITSRFVCGSARLGELATLARTNRSPAFETTVVGRPTSDRSGWETALTTDAAAMNAFSTEMRDAATIAGYEIRVPNLTDLGAWLDDLRGFDHVDLFVEIPLGEGLEDAVAMIAEREGYGVKARTGGLEANAFPSVEDVSRFIHACVSAEVPFKMTAGLHHPLRQFRSEVGTTMHGFLNVLLATCYAIHEDASTAEIASLVAEDRAENLTLGESHVRWRDVHLPLDAIEDARALFTAFGSCSIEEPIQDLIDLGFLEAIS